MDFLIADTFTDSLARLTGEEQKAVKTTAFDLQMNLAAPGLKFHKLDKVKDKNFWSVRVNADIRIIVHKTAASLLLCYVNHHDKAYDWAGRRKLETHPKTGAAQLVEIRQTVQQIFLPLAVPHAPLHPVPPAPLKKPALFAGTAAEVLLGYGVPEEWLADVMEATEDTLLILADHLPAEAAEALLELATGGQPRMPKPVAATADPFGHPDAQRRFRVMTNVEELERALEFPWDKWTVFLHPEQLQWVERDYAGPARVSGSAGTGKTIVALHRAAFLARKHPHSRVLLATFSDTLAMALQTRVKRLTSNEPKLSERLEVHSLEALGQRLYKLHVGPLNIVSRMALVAMVKAASDAVEGHLFSLTFLMTEWDQVVDAWQLKSWEAYRDVARLGRKTRLPEPQRQVLWSIFEKVRADLTGAGLVTGAEVFTQLAEKMGRAKNLPFDYLIVDEAQDLSVSQLRFFAAMGGSRPNALFFAGDPGQRIFQQSFSWLGLGVDIRGRSRTLRVNYRTSHQIRSQSDRLLGPEISDADGNVEERKDTISVFNGPPPVICVAQDEADEIEVVGQWLLARTGEGVVPHEIGIFVRSAAQLERAKSAAAKAGLPCKVLDDHVETVSGSASVCTMHLAKGLEFRAVVVMACDDEVIPLQERVEQVGEDSDLKEVYDTERHLLYVACTRARDFLLVTAAGPASEFLDDMRL
ncbi:MAG: helicase [Verrucomicrobiales bacterium]|nr:helicase [Verrucomicrobiales bacterium]